MPTNSRRKKRILQTSKKNGKEYEVIDRMFAAVLSANESEATIKALRPQVEKAVREEHADPRC